MTPAGPQPRLPWYRRLAFHLAVLLGLTVLAFQFVFVPLYEGILTRFDLPVPGEVYVLDPFTDLEGTPIEDYLDQLANALLLGALDPMTGAVNPTEEAYAVVDRLMSEGEGYAWIDADNIVRHSSRLVPWMTGTEWPFGMQSDTDLPLDDEGGVATVIYTPKYRAGQHVGTLAWLSRYEDDGANAFTGAIDPANFTGKIIRTDKQLADKMALKSLATRILAIVLAISVTAALIWALSRFVTRRIGRLAQQAAMPAGPEGMPGPFEVEGGDEIALLGQAMNQMRQRGLDLLEGLRRRDVHRREWVAQVSHDLRTPLTALIACLNRAETMLDNPDKEELREVLNVARYDADRVQTLADDLLEIARLEAADDLLLEPVPPGELARQAARGLAPHAHAQGLALRTSIAPVLPTIEADGRRLMRAIENLLRNAIQHATAVVELSVERDADELRFVVLDDGPGLPALNGTVDLAALSDSPSRTDSSGLGLKVARRVAEAHGGNVRGDNRAEGGAKVSFCLPLQASGSDSF